ncbi:MAG: hypothetical protein ACNA8W_16210 [Bradymonadaceae bacterium]
MSLRNFSSLLAILASGALAMSCASGPSVEVQDDKVREDHRPGGSQAGVEEPEPGKSVPLGTLAIHLIVPLDDGSMGMHLGAPTFGEDILGEYEEFNWRTWMRRAQVESHAGISVGQTIQAAAAKKSLLCTVTGFAEVTRGVIDTQALLEQSEDVPVVDRSPQCGEPAAFAYLDCDGELDEVAVGLLNLDVSPVHYMSTEEISWDLVERLTETAHKAPGFGQDRLAAIARADEDDTGYAEGIDYRLFSPTHRVSPRARDLVVLTASASSGTGETRCGATDFRRARRFIYSVENDVMTGKLMEDVLIEERVDEVLFLVDLNGDGVPEMVRLAHGDGTRITVESLEAVLDETKELDCNPACP